MLLATIAANKQHTLHNRDNVATTNVNNNTHKQQITQFMHQEPERWKRITDEGPVPVQRGQRYEGQWVGDVRHGDGQLDFPWGVAVARSTRSARKTRRMRRVFRLLPRQERLSRKKRTEKARRLRSAPSDASRRRFVS